MYTGGTPEVFYREEVTWRIQISKSVWIKHTSQIPQCCIVLGLPSVPRRDGTREQGFTALAAYHRAVLAAVGEKTSWLKGGIGIRGTHLG